MRLRLLPKVLILAGIVLTAGLYYSRENLRLDWEDLVELANIQIDNFSYPFNAERSRPVSSLETETNLKVMSVNRLSASPRANGISSGISFTGPIR